MLNNIHDSFFKNIFTVKEDLQDLLRGTLPPDILHQADLDSLEYDPNEYVDDELVSHFADICCNMCYGKQQLKVSLLYEHKSYPDKHVHLQLLSYILNIWESQVDHMQELTPVICVVFYHGKSRWPHADFLRNVPDELQQYLPLFNFILFDTREMEDQAITRHFKSPSVKIGVWFLKQRENLINFIQDNPDLARKIFKEIGPFEKKLSESFFVYLYNVSGVAPDKINKIMKTVVPDIPPYYNKHHRKIIQESFEKGVVKTARNMIRKGLSDEQIADYTELGIRRIQDLRKEAQV